MALQSHLHLQIPADNGRLRNSFSAGPRRAMLSSLLTRANVTLT